MSVRTPPPAFDGFFRQHYRSLVGALSIAVGRVQAEDAVQEAFIQANLRWARVSAMDQPEAWVRRVALNRLIDGHRRSRRHERALTVLQGDADRPAPDVERGDPELAAAVAALSERQRIAVSLHYLLDLPVAEIADLLGVSQGTVKSHLHDARRALRERLGVTEDG
jgi:RNA polymerase sigma-70 factor (ECF subfamily)